MRKGKRGHKLGKKEKSAYVEEEVERKTTGNIRRRESTELSLLASRLDTNFYFYWSIENSVDDFQNIANPVSRGGDSISSHNAQTPE